MMADEASPTDGAFSRHHTPEARRLYTQAQKESAAAGREYLLPASMLLALWKNTPLLDAVDGS